MISTSSDSFTVYYYCKANGSFDEAMVKEGVTQLFKDMNYVGELTPDQLKKLCEWVKEEATKRGDL